MSPNWRFNFSVFHSPPRWLAHAVVGILSVFGAILILLALVAIVRLSVDLFGADHQRASDAVRSLLPIAAAAVGLPLIVWRLVILNEQTRISELKTQIDRETHYTSIFSKSIEQLGQTRELKESVQREGTLDSVTKTVPNIEVRLGGIHSLTRLSEESPRDALKIENMLLSYIRENSWSDRSGATVERIVRQRNHSFKWTWDCIGGQPSSKYKAELMSWMDKAQQGTDAARRWGNKTVETRVDVNEAIDAAVAASHNAGKSDRSLFYECLFVGRFFTAPFLQASRFARCAFVRCRFEGPDLTDLQFTSCHLIACTLSTTSSKILFRLSFLTGMRIQQANNTTVAFEHCELSDSSFVELKDCALEFSYCEVLKSSVSAKIHSENAIMLKASAFVQCHFTNLAIGPNSRFQHTAFADTEFRSCDLSKLTDIKDSPLQNTSASPDTKHPEIDQRPIGWPEYNASKPFLDDDIPF